MSDLFLVFNLDYERILGTRLQATTIKTWRGQVGGGPHSLMRWKLKEEIKIKTNNFNALQKIGDGCSGSLGSLAYSSDQFVDEQRVIFFKQVDKK